MPDTWMISKEAVTGNAHTCAAYRLGRNEFGLWLYIPPGTPMHNAQGEQVDSLPAQATLIPDDKPWVAAWRQDGTTHTNVTTRPAVDHHSVRYTDLGLHVWTDESGHVVSDPLDPYEQAVAAGHVTAEQDAAARAALAELQQQMTERAEPFGGMGRRWFTGIARNELHFIAYNPDWPARFRSARDEILPQLPPGSQVEHVGSTAVPGLAAKDCIDIAAVVPTVTQINAAIAALAPLGYEARPNAFNDSGHVFLRRLDQGHRSQHLHLYREGHPNLIEVLAFRDLLRADPNARERYRAVKQSLAEANPYDRSGYLAGKNEVVHELLQLALS